MGGGTALQGSCYKPTGAQTRGTRWMFRQTGQRVSGASCRKRLKFWSNSDLHFNIVKSEGRFPSESPSSCYRRNTSRHKSRIFLFSVSFLLLLDSSDCNKCYDKIPLKCLYNTKCKGHSEVYCIRTNPTYLVLCQVPRTIQSPVSGLSLCWE